MNEHQIVLSELRQIEHYRQLDPNRNPARVYLKTLSPGSRPAMESALNIIAGIMKEGATLDDVLWDRLRYEHTVELRNLIIERQVKITRRNKKDIRKDKRKDKPDSKKETTQPQSPTTTNRMLTALRQVLKQAWKLGQMSTDEYTRAAAIENAPGGTSEDTGRMLTVGEMISLFEACLDNTKAGARDAAMFAVAAGGGLRRAEIAGLDLADYDSDTGAVLVRRGKRNKTRKVPLPAGTADALDYWIEIRGEEDGPIFPHIDKADQLHMRRLTPQSIQLVFDKRATKAKISTFTPHDLRRTYISNLLDGGTDIATVQRLAGHSNINTTSRYDKRGERAMFQAAKTLHVPFERPTPD